MMTYLEKTQLVIKETLTENKFVMDRKVVIPIINVRRARIKGTIN